MAKSKVWRKDQGTLRGAALLLFLVVLGSDRFSVAIAQSSMPAPVNLPKRPCVLLENGNVVFGTVDQLGAKVIIRQGDDEAGGELVVRTADVACWADSLEQLYQYRVDHRRGDRVQTRLADVRWCLRNGLIDQAFADLAEVRRLDPNNRLAGVLMRQAESQQRQIVESLFRSATRFDTTATESGGNVRPVSFDTPIRRDDAAKDQPTGLAAPTPDIESGPVLSQFTRNAQPLLLNRCGRCHDDRRDLNWSLIVPAGGGRPSTGITRQNLAATLELLTDSGIGTTGFLRAATEIHGDATTPPLGIADAVATARLRQWLHTVDRNRSGDAPGIDPDSETIAVSASNASRSSEFPSNLEAVIEDTTDGPASPSQPSAGTPKPRHAIGQPARLPVVADPFDPARFNKQFHR